MTRAATTLLATLAAVLLATLGVAVIAQPHPPALDRGPACRALSDQETQLVFATLLTPDVGLAGRIVQTTPSPSGTSYAAARLTDGRTAVWEIQRHGAGPVQAVNTAAQQASPEAGQPVLVDQAAADQAAACIRPTTLQEAQA